MYAKFHGNGVTNLCCILVFIKCAEKKIRSLQNEKLSLTLRACIFHKCIQWFCLNLHDRMLKVEGSYNAMQKLCAFKKGLWSYASMQMHFLSSPRCSALAFLAA